MTRTVELYFVIFYLFKQEIICVDVRGSTKCVLKIMKLLAVQNIRVLVTKEISYDESEFCRRKSFVIMLRSPSQILVWIILSGPVTNVFEWIFM
jgi:hypothetical protein